MGEAQRSEMAGMAGVLLLALATLAATAPIDTPKPIPVTWYGYSS